MGDLELRMSKLEGNESVKTEVSTKPKDKIAADKNEEDDDDFDLFASDEEEEESDDRKKLLEKYHEKKAKSESMLSAFDFLCFILQT